jgi:hypothetical protein
MKRPDVVNKNYIVLTFIAFPNVVVTPATGSAVINVYSLVNV